MVVLVHVIAEVALAGLERLLLDGDFGYQARGVAFWVLMSDCLARSASTTCVRDHIEILSVLRCTLDQLTCDYIFTITRRSDVLVAHGNVLLMVVVDARLFLAEAKLILVAA